MDKMMHWVVETVHRTPLHSIPVCSLVMDRVSLSAGFGSSVYNSERLTVIIMDNVFRE